MGACPQTEYTYPPGIASTSTPKPGERRIRRQLGRHDGAQLDDRVGIAALDPPSPRHHARRVERKLRRVEEEHLPNLGLEWVEPEGRDRRSVGPSGTVSFSSTLSAPLTSSISRIRSSPTSREPESVVMSILSFIVIVGDARRCGWTRERTFSAASSWRSTAKAVGVIGRRTDESHSTNWSLVRYPRTEPGVIPCGVPRSGPRAASSGENHSGTRRHRSVAPVVVIEPSASAPGHPCRPRARASSVASAHRTYT